MKLTRRVFFAFLFVAFGLAAAACSAPAPASAGFAIYLLQDPSISGTQVESMPLGALKLQPQPLISAGDILYYDWTTHEIGLTPQAFPRVEALFGTPVRVDGVPFVVCVGQERIYAGAFWTPLSSLSFDGVVIMQPFDQAQQTIRIQRGYPGPDFAKGPDPRADERIKSALEAANKLKVVTPVPAAEVQRLRVRNAGKQPIKQLTVILPEDRVLFGDVPAGATTDYVPFPHGVLRYAAYQYEIEGALKTQPVVDWIGEEPMAGEDFTYVLDYDPTRVDALRFRLQETIRDR